MDILLWTAAIVGFLALNLLLLSFICFYLTFFSKKRVPLKEDEFEIPEGDIYLPHKEEMEGWTRSCRTLAHRDIEIASHDGLTLRGKYYEYKKGAITEILFHGYRGNAERDMGGGIERCFALGRNAILVDQRGSGASDGHVISFGINECKDCVKWANFAVDYLGKDAKIILTGVSMGAATVMMAAGEDLPENVVCVLADCGYSTPEQIIKKVLKDIKLPPDFFYFFIRLGAILYGRFDPDSNSPEQALKKAKIPVIFIHGESDDFVPCEMSKAMYEICASKHKKIVTIENSGHGLAYPIDKKKYLSALKEFQEECGF